MEKDLSMEGLLVLAREHERLEIAREYVRKKAYVDRNEMAIILGAAMDEGQAGKPQENDF